MEAAAASLTETPPAVEKAKTQLEEGLKLVCERQKLIGMADRLEHGWATVEEYLEDELADMIVTMKSVCRRRSFGRGRN